MEKSQRTGFIGHCAGLTQDTAVPSTMPWGAQVPLPTSSCCSALWQGSQHWAAHESCFVKACFAGYNVTCHQVIWGQCCPGQISEDVVLWSFLFFPPNARNHKDFNSLRNCSEMKILLKNNSFNMFRTCFYFCSYVFRAMLGCGYACGANSSFPTVTMWQKHSRDVKGRRSCCSRMLSPMCPEPKSPPVSAALGP